MKIFDDFKRTDPRPARFSEPHYSFMNRVKNLEVQKIRNKLEEWFIRYPAHSKNDLKSRFKKDFDGALFELFMYKFFCNLGFRGTSHPEISLSGKTPDFLFDCQTLSFYLEATVVRDISEDEQKRENIMNVVYDAINTIDSPNFYLDLSDFELKSLGSPSIANLRSFIIQESLKYDPDKVIKEIQFDISKTPIIPFEDSSIKTSIKLIPKGPLYRDNSFRPIGITVSGAEFPTTNLSIRKSIEKKAKKYRNIDRPLIAAINSIGGLGYYEHEIIDILFGRKWVEEKVSNYDCSFLHQTNGLFYNGRRPSNQHLSAVFVTSLFLANCHKMNYQLFSNPYANYPIGFNDLNSMSFEKGYFKKSPGKTSGEIMGLSDDWLAEIWNLDDEI